MFDTLATIVVSQRCGFTLAEIGELLAPDAFAEGKDKLQTKLNELRDQRHRLDLAITGLEHALECTYPVPRECPGFSAILADVLPVDR